MSDESKKLLSRQGTPGLPKLLHDLRVSAGFSQENVAAALGVSRPTYTYYELGKTVPSAVMLGKLALIFKIPVEVFFDPSRFPKLPSEKKCQKRVRGSSVWHRKG